MPLAEQRLSRTMCLCGWLLVVASLIGAFWHLSALAGLLFAMLCFDSDPLCSRCGHPDDAFGYSLSCGNCRADWKNPR